MAGKSNGYTPKQAEEMTDTGRGVPGVKAPKNAPKSGKKPPKSKTRGNK